MSIYDLKKFNVRIFLVLNIFCMTIHAQDTTSLNRGNPVTPPKSEYPKKIFKATIAPVLLIGLGVSEIHDNGIYSSHKIYREIHEHLRIERTHVDDYLQYVPYAGLATLNLLKIKSRDDHLNTVLLSLKSIALNFIIVYSLKYSVYMVRPDSTGPERTNSFPSGHTANAFTAATLLHKEFGKESIWYSIGGYGVASTVGVFRMLNNRHWFSDVLAGAGIGILSTNLIYLTHKYRWGNSPLLSFTPFVNRYAAGVMIRKKL